MSRTIVTAVLRRMSLVALVGGVAFSNAQLIHAQTPQGYVTLPPQGQLFSSQATAPTMFAQQPEPLEVAPKPDKPEQLNVTPQPEGLAPSYSQPAREPVLQPSSLAEPETQRGAFLAPGEFIATYQWNYSYADKIFLGGTNLVEADQAVDLVSVQNEHVAAVEIGLWERLSFVYELPFQYNVRSLNVAPLSGGDLTGRLVQRSGGIADSRAYFRYWLCPDEDSNIAVYVGMKIPTGVEDSGDVYQDRFLYNDISIQTGTGSWDPLAGFFFYRRMLTYFTFFGGFNYRLTPSAQTDALALDPLLANPNSTILNSIPDQLSGDLGFNFNLGQWGHETGRICHKRFRNFIINFAVVVAAVPEHDLIGSDDGYRRAFNALYLRPGIYWSPKEDVSVFVNAPITVHRDLTVPGSFPDIQYSAGLVYRW